MKYILKHICLLITVLAMLLLIGMAFATQCNANSSPEVVMVEIEAQPAYNVTSVEREMLARLVFREANTESIECQQAVVSVVINRWLSGIWGDTIEEVIYAPHQFSPANWLYCTTPIEQNYEAVDYVIQNGVTVPSGVLYFRSEHHFSWQGYTPYIVIDNMYFGYMNKDWK